MLVDDPNQAARFALDEHFIRPPQYQSYCTAPVPQLSSNCKQRDECGPSSSSLFFMMASAGEFPASVCQGVIFFGRSASLSTLPRIVRSVSGFLSLGPFLPLSHHRLPLVHGLPLAHSRRGLHVLSKSYSFGPSNRIPSRRPGLENFGRLQLWVPTGDKHGGCSMAASVTPRI